MSNLDNLTSKILNDAKEKADNLEKETKKIADEKYENSIKKYNAKSEVLLESGNKEIELIVDRIKSNTNLKIRNEKLRAKQQVINRVIDRLRERLVNMNESEYINYLERNIERNELNKNKTLVIKKEYLQKVKEIFNNFKINENEFVNSGFIIEENGIQENYTFEVKLEFMRDELEVEISKLLFV